MPKKQDGKAIEPKQYAKYAVVGVDGRSWDFKIPVYLDGSLEEGDHVVIRRDGEYAVGQVTGLRASTEHREENVRLIVDKVRTKRYLRLREREAAKADIMSAAVKRAEELDGIAGLKARAEGDPALSKCMAALAEMSDDPALS